MRRLRLGCLGYVLLAMTGCADMRSLRPTMEVSPQNVRPTRIEYVDADGFDTLLETLFVNQDPVIVVQTRNDKPDWNGRLNAWIAAWNRGGRAAGGAQIRLQAPLVPGIKVDGDSIREFRLLVESFMSRIDERAQQTSAWWAEERTRNRRVNLLKPYNLRFHVGQDGFIQLIFFNGKYEKYYASFVRSLAGAEDETEWSRSWCCSLRAPAQPSGRVEGILTSNNEPSIAKP